MVVNISDADFTAASGQAMKYRLQPMTNLAGKINRRLTKSIKQLYKLICSNPAGDLEPDDWQKIDVKYTLNLPANLLDEAQTAGAMSGITSRRTQLQVMSVVPDVDAELEQIEKESDVTAYTTDYETDRGGGSGEGGEG
jgi:SPP1 family phage portal protein